MSIAVRGKGDQFTDQVLDALGQYLEQHQGAEIEAYRQSPVSIRVRIIDPDFSGISRAERHEIIWHYLEKLPEDVQSQVSLLLPLTPEETTTSLANFEFENPIPSSL
jgi:stress-induced morphogen